MQTKNNKNPLGIRMCGHVICISTFTSQSWVKNDNICNRAVLRLFMVVLLLFIRSHDMLLFPVLRMNTLSVGPIVLPFIVPLLLTLVCAYMNTP